MSPSDNPPSTNNNNICNFINNITGLSHISLSAPTDAQFTNSCAFYTALGFKPITTHDNPKEALLLLCTTTEQTSLSSNSTDLSLIIKLAPNQSAEAPSTNIESALTAPVAICLVCRDITAMEAELKRLGRPCRKVTFAPTNTGGGSQDSHPAELYVLDPAGHTIVFTNRLSAFSTATNVGSSRKTTDKPTPSKLFNAIVDGAARKKKIGILTSGGDAPGMNAAVRSIVRVSIARGCDPYAIYEGYEGLVNGGDMIKKMSWESVRGWLSLGGTNIGTARCASFRTREGRLKAAHNLIINGIDALVVIGGDGSLTGADKLRAEWPTLLKDLVDQKKLTAQEIEPYQYLTIVGLVGSIDNDMSLTDITIGAVSSLHRVCEAVDNIASTAMSHGRAFVVEVMGRHCGWLALSSAISTGADWVFLPECPPSADNWEEDMSNRLKKNRIMGKRMTIVIVCEGAIDRNVQPIKSDQIKDILVRMGLDTRVTTLGHVQRGGTPCAFDRYLATLQGVEAVEAVLRSTPDTPSPMIGMSENKITCVPLVKAVETTHAVAKAIEEKDFVRAMDLRDPEFASTFEANQAVNLLENPAGEIPAEKRLRVGILHVGAPAGGMNAAARTAARLCISRGHSPLAIRNGFPGLCAGDVTPLKWLDLEGWVTKGGCELGTNRNQPDVDIGQCAYQLQRHNIQALIIIGGFEAFTALSSLEKHRCNYPSFCIPMIVIPATISNNVPGTEYSIGSDTALNAIVDSCDRIKQSATASRRRVFVVETQGGKCGYLATLSGLAAGATSVYIPEEGLSLKRLQQDVEHLVRRYNAEPAGTSEGRLVLRCETTSSTYTTEVVSAILKEEGRGVFDSRTAILGHTQQGGTPSPLDRIRATRLAVRSVHWIEQQAYAALERNKEAGLEGDGLYGRHVFRDDPESAVVIGIRGAHIAFTPVRMLKGETDVKNRKALNQWWMDLGKLIRLLAKYEC